MRIDQKQQLRQLLILAGVRGHFRLLPATDCARIATCQKLWRSIAADDSLWQAWAQEDFLLEQATAPTGHLQDTWRWAKLLERNYDATDCASHHVLTYRQAYACWQAAFGRYKTYAKRAIRAWRTIEDWTKVQHPELYLSLG